VIDKRKEFVEGPPAPPEVRESRGTKMTVDRWRRYEHISSPIEINDKDVRKKFLTRYPPLSFSDIPARYVVAHPDGAIYLPMYDYEGYEMGVVVKPNRDDRPKSLTYKYKDSYDGMSWYLRPDSLRHDEVYVVEDALSALSLWTAGVDAVSLNGTMLNQDRVETLMARKWRVILCLDADATSKAIYYRSKYMGMYDIQVRRLIKDIKNMDLDEVRNFLAG